MLDAVQEATFRQLRINNSISMASALDVLHAPGCTWADVIAATNDGNNCLRPAPSNMEGPDDRRGGELPRVRKIQTADQGNADKGDKGHSSSDKILICGEDSVAVDRLAQIALEELRPWKCFKLCSSMPDVLDRYPVLCRGFSRPADVPYEAGDRLPSECIPGKLYTDIHGC